VSSSGSEHEPRSAHCVQIGENAMPLIFYERVGHEERGPSPFSWRIGYAPAHKGIDLEVRRVRYSLISRLSVP